MPITATRALSTLTWDDYDQRDVVIDPADGTQQDAFTSFRFDLRPNLPAERVDGRFRLPRSMQIAISPIALVDDDAAQTDDLLSHEQVHYDVGFVIARQLARELNVIDAATDRDLRKMVDDLFQLHFHTRARLIQSRYDRETQHGVNAHFQRVWKNNMSLCLANPQAFQIGGWML